MYVWQRKTCRIEGFIKFAKFTKSPHFLPYIHKHFLVQTVIFSDLYVLFFLVTVTNGQIPPTLSLARYLRSHLGLTGTKIMCNQAGCGACIVTAYVPDDTNEKGYKTISVNSVSD